MFQERNVKCFYINTPRLTKDQRVSICLEYARVNNAREVIPAALGRSLTTNVHFLTIARLSTGYCCIRYLIGRFWLILDTFKNGSLRFKRSSLGQYCTKMHRLTFNLAFKLKQIKQVNFFLRHPVYIYI